MRKKHTNEGLYCPACEEKLDDGHPKLRIYHHKVREYFPDAHLSCVWRGEQEQNQAFAEKKSTLKWPQSKHNKMHRALPQSQAMDYFRLGADHKPYWEKQFFLRIANHLDDIHADITWGGDWKNFPDFPHFELKSV